MNPLGRSLAGLLATAVLAGCGGGDDEDRLVVFAASSLQPAFERYAEESGVEAMFSFAGSDTLAAQIRRGVEPDVYAAANDIYPGQLHDEGLLAQPVRFATNELVVAVRADSSITSAEDLARPGVSVALGEEGVPVGDYARAALAALPGGTGKRILANVASAEPDVAGVVAKLERGAVDAGLVYRSDVVAARAGLRAIRLPASARPGVAYAAAAGASGDEAERAREFIDGLLHGAGAGALGDAGFGTAPGGGGGG